MSEYQRYHTCMVLPCVLNIVIMLNPDVILPIKLQTFITDSAATFSAGISNFRVGWEKILTCWNKIREAQTYNQTSFDWNAKQKTKNSIFCQKQSVICKAIHVIAYDNHKSWFFAPLITWPCWWRCHFIWYLQLVTSNVCSRAGTTDSEHSGLLFLSSESQSLYTDATIKRPQALTNPIRVNLFTSVFEGIVSAVSSIVKLLAMPIPQTSKDW